MTDEQEMKDNMIRTIGILTLIALSIAIACTVVSTLPAPVAGGLFLLGAATFVGLAAWGWGIVD